MQILASALFAAAISLSFGGAKRSYVLHVPPGLHDPAPLVISLHGGGSNAEQQERFSGMDALADRAHFVVVYPNGTGRGSMFVWNAGTCCGAAPAKGIDDVGFIRAVVEDVAKRVSIDRNRVYATGMSNGAMMTYRIAAEAPDLVAAVAPVAGSMVLARFQATTPVPIMHFHSVDDPRALYNGGLGLPFPGTQMRVLHPPVEEQLAKWIAIDGCSATPKIEKLVRGKPGTGDEGNTATKLVYTPCSTGAEVILWKLTGSGHVWPGRDSRLPRLLGRATHVVDADEEMWSFFTQYRLSRPSRPSRP
jgi:polyhydroxybutyrate depolymerase